MNFLSKIKWYFVIVVGIVGYYGYYQKTHELYLMWITILLIGGVMTGKDNLEFYKKTKSNIVFLDTWAIIILFLIPNINMNYGLSILLSAVLGIVYAFIISKIKEEFIQKSLKSSKQGN